MQHVFRSSALATTVALATLTLAAFALAGCDGGLSGQAADNLAPQTDLSVRDSSLVGRISDADRLSSTVALSWSGTDPDGFVAGYEVRYYGEAERPGAEERWTPTTRRDTLVLLPIPRGGRFGNVVVEVRAVDNEGVKDPTPARTVFPIRNAPPSIALSRTDVPPDTTFTVASFGFTATDPEGTGNLARIEIALNDSTRWFPLPADAQYVTLVAENVDRANAAQTTAEARVYLGRTFQATQVRVPGLRLNARNVFYARAVDQTDTTSVVARFPAANSGAKWYVRKPRTRVLVVNDYRKQTSPVVVGYHLGLLREHLGFAPDVWNVEQPYVTGSTGTAARSPLLGPTQEPALRETFALFDAVYWITTGSTDSPSRNSLPFAAPAMQKFLAQGGKLMVHSPVTVPQSSADFQDNLDNPALFLLPVTRLVAIPDSLRSLSLPTNAPVRPLRALPNVAEALPPLRLSAFVITTLPYEAADSRTFAVYDAEYQYQTRVAPRRTGTWPGPSAAASFRLGDNGQPNVGLFALPLVNEATGEPLLRGEDGTPDAGRVAAKLLLRSLRFGQ